MFSIHKKKINIPSNPLNASLSIYVMEFPSNSSEFKSFRCEKTFASIRLRWLWANIKESKFLKPSKSPSLIVSMRFSWTSSFLRVSNIKRAFCGMAVRWLPPKFKRFSFLLNIFFFFQIIIQDVFIINKIYLNLYLSNPLKASGSMTVILFSYNVNISRVSNPSNARLWIEDILLWFKFKINRWCKFFNALDGTFCNWFCDTSSWVKPFPEIKTN